MTARRLVRHLSVVTPLALPDWSAGPKEGIESWGEAIAAVGYAGVQVLDGRTAELMHAAGLQTSGIGRADTPAAVAGLVDRCEQWGATAVSVHLGTGFEDDRRAAGLVEALLRAQERSSVPVLLETHRATLTQDPARAIRFATEHPALRFCGDFAHWYTGVEMVYGDIEAKFEAMAPVLARTRMVHGRISDPGCIQVAVEKDDDREFVSHFRRFWRESFEGYLADPDAPDELLFVPELLPAAAHYARTIPSVDGPREEADRWTQALLLCDLAEEIFDQASAAQEASRASIVST